MEVSKNIFKAYDIRGIYKKELTTSSVKQIAKSLCSIYKSGNNKIVIGRDGRLSSHELSKALINQFLECGKDVVDIGQVPTPVLYYAVENLKLNSGIMITGSHNPKEYNGLKIIMDGHTLAGDEIKNIYTSILEKKLSKLNYAKTNLQNINFEFQYINSLLNDIKIKKKIKIVIDGGNGVAGKLAVKVFENLGLDIIDLYCDVDGNFPNHSPNPSELKNLNDLVKLVKEKNYDLGIAFDGDGDRCVLIDNLGNVLWPDKQMMLYSKNVLANNKGANIVYDIKSSKNLKGYIKNYGGNPIICRTGHSYIKKKMKEVNAILGGEMSGHIFFHDRWYGFDDGIYAAARMIEILAQEDTTSFELFDELPKSFSTPEINIKVNKDGFQHDFMKKFSSVAKFPDSVEIIKIDGLRVEYGNGWGLLRASNTSPYLVMRFEADTKQCLNEIRKKFIDEILKIDSTLEIPNG